METRITDWLDRFDLSDDADKRIDDYSKGMRQKVGLIQALLHDPDVVFLDEPTSGLDPRAARTVLDVIADLTDDGHTVFLSTHILSVVEELADVVGVSMRVTSLPRITHRADGTDGSGGGTTLEDVFLSVTAEPGPAASESAPRNTGDAAARQDGRVDDDGRVEDR